MRQPDFPSLLHRLPLTRYKLVIARIIYCFLSIFIRNPVRKIVRHAIRYEVDLSEGIDLSLFLFGQFQNYLLNNKWVKLKSDDVIFDIGANIGGMTLRFSQLVPQGHVYAFEPTHYGYCKLKNNVALNPSLSERITCIQMFLSDATQNDPKIQAYSSWKINGPARQGAHALHGGTINSAESIPSVTLDDFCEQESIQSISLIKIDTDGHEWKVLCGAMKTIQRLKPKVIFEMALYLLEENNETCEQYIRFFLERGYRVINLKNGREVTLENARRDIPLKSSTDILALPVASV